MSDPVVLEIRREIMELVEVELESAYLAHGDRVWTRHEFYGVLMEEVEELFDVIKANGSADDFMAELIQVAAVCFRYAENGIG